MTHPAWSALLLPAVAVIGLSLGGCDAAVSDPSGVPRTPLFTLETDLLDHAPPSDAHAVAVAVFWLTEEILTARSGRLLEQTTASAAAALDALGPTRVNVFEPPPDDAYAAGRDWALGAILAFDDRDGDGRFGPGDRLLGGAPSDLVVHARAPVPGARSPFRRDLAPGFRLVAGADVACPAVTVEPAGSCADRAGEPCAADADCGALGACRSTLGGVTLPGGLCTKRPACQSARLVGGPGFSALDDLFVPRCRWDADCRVDEGYLCERVAGYVPVCLPPTDRLCDTAIGAPCAGDPDCGADGRCILTSSTFGAFPGGACTRRDDADCRPVRGRLAVYDVDPQGGGRQAVLAECRGAGDCRAGYRCEPPTSVCVPDAATDCVLAGSPCNDGAQCGVGGICADFEADLGALPGGMCLAAYGAAGCTWRDGAAVTTAPETVTHLLRACGEDADCREAEGYWCNQGLGACVPPAGGGCAVDLGAPCAQDADCGAGLCLTETPLQPIPRFPGGYCTASNGSGCRASDGVYYPLFADRGLLRRCAADVDCRADYRCDPWRRACVPARRVGLRLSAPFALALPMCP